MHFSQYPITFILAWSCQMTFHLTHITNFSLVKLELNPENICMQALFGSAFSCRIQKCL